MPRRMRRAAAAYAKAVTGMALIALLAAACTPGGSTAGGAARSSSEAATVPPGGAPTAAQARPDIVLSARSGGSDAAILGTVTVPSLLAHKAVSCPSAGQGASQRALLRATWSYRGGTTYLSRLSGGFDLKTGVALPFLTVTLDPRGSGPRGRLRLWTSGLLEGNNVSGYHTTGWIAAGAPGGPLAIRLADPYLAIQVWAADPLTNLVYCVTSTGFSLGTR
jgi:hypothetical protein